MYPNIYKVKNAQQINKMSYKYYNFEKYFQGYNYIPFAGVSVEEVVVAIEGLSVSSKNVEK